MVARIPIEIQILAIAVVVDLLFGDPPNKIHPTAWIGITISWLDKISPQSNRDRFMYGLVIVVLIPALWSGLSYIIAQSISNINPIAHVIVAGLILKTTFSIRMLHRTASSIKTLLMQDNITQVRIQMSSLVSRDTRFMTKPQATAATIESVSENITDSFVGPILAFALFGLPGAVAYRAINTLDSMIGYRGKYEYLGKPSAKLDDFINLIPARLSACLLLISSIFLPGQSFTQAWKIMRRDHSRTASPNAGWTMSVIAGSLGILLEKEGQYQLGEAKKAIEPKDISRTIQSMYFSSIFTIITASAIIMVIHGGL